MRDGAQLINKAIRRGGGGVGSFSCKIHNLSLFEMNWTTYSTKDCVNFSEKQFHSKESV